MKEMKRGDMKTRFGWTDVLDPTGKQYLCQDTQGTFHILVWKATFKASGEWTGSSWFTDKECKDQAHLDVHRVWQLPTIEYAKPKPYTHQQHLKKKR